MNPWEEAAAKAALDAWTTAMLGLWDAGLWVLRLAQARPTTTASILG